MKKTCIKCNINKELSCFTTKKTSKDGHKGTCRECVRKYDKEREHSEIGVINRIYSDQKGSSKKRGYALPSYTKTELSVWMYNNGFKELYKKWVESGFNKMEKPSVDRNDDYSPYSLEACTLTTWGKNKENFCKDTKSGKTNKINKEVVQISADGSVVGSFYSASEASRCTGIHKANIAAVARGHGKTAGGYIWEYKNKNKKD